MEIMVEKYVFGKELTIGCIDGKACAVTEIRPKVDFYDYEAKYTDGVTEHVLPAEIPDNVAEKCKRWAERLHKMLGCNMVSRIDVRYNEKDGPVFLEINTHPGMTALSLLPEQALLMLWQAAIWLLLRALPSSCTAAAAPVTS